MNMRRLDDRLSRLELERYQADSRRLACFTDDELTALIAAEGGISREESDFLDQCSDAELEQIIWDPGAFARLWAARHAAHAAGRRREES